MRLQLCTKQTNLFSALFFSRRDIRISSRSSSLNSLPSVQYPQRKVQFLAWESFESLDTRNTSLINLCTLSSLVIPLALTYTGFIPSDLFYYTYFTSSFSTTATFYSIVLGSSPKPLSCIFYTLDTICLCYSLGAFQNSMLDYCASYCSLLCSSILLYSATALYSLMR